jgi:hypothetical protein
MSDFSLDQSMETGIVLGINKRWMKSSLRSQSDAMAGNNIYHGRRLILCLSQSSQGNNRIKEDQISFNVQCSTLAVTEHEA